MAFWMLACVAGSNHVTSKVKLLAHELLVHSKAAPRGLEFHSTHITCIIVLFRALGFLNSWDFGTWVSLLDSFFTH